MVTVTLLGTAATMPLPDRALTTALLACEGHSLLFDCGEGTQAAALRAGEWSSKTARDGIWHKLGSVVAVIVAAILYTVIGHLLDNVPGMELPFTYTVLLCPLVVIWYILTEAGSIIENAGALGAPIPAWLTKMIASLGAKVDQAGDNLEN